MSIETFSDWQDGKKKILVILAHPDDPEFFLGGTLAKWIADDHQVEYCLLTKGEKGSNSLSLSSSEIAETRVVEQHQAADYLKVKSVEFLNYEDGGVQSDLVIRKELCGLIRRHRPQILVTCDPTHFFDGQRYINHPDHRAAGLAVIESVFPAAGNHFYYSELEQEGLYPHSVEEVWMSLTGTPNIQVEVSQYWETRLEALEYHASQIGDPILFRERMRGWLKIDKNGNFEYFEKFRRIILKR